MNRPAWFVAALLAMLAAVMGLHLLLLHTGMAECDAYQRALLSRLERTTIGGPQAQALRTELQAYLSGKTSECAEAEAVYEEASERYQGTILALLGGSGIAAGLGSRRQDDGPPT